jgi:hypothetical protein
MSIFVTSTAAPAARTADSSKISVLYAVVLVAFAVTQLFTFEAFLPYIQSLHLPLGESFNYILVPLIVVAEIFAIPFLLRMRLSPAFRYMSMGLGCIAAVLWVFITLWINLSNVSVETVGFMGDVVTLAPGWWAVFISLALGVLAIWSSWGLWPGTRSVS